jgi:hypothetical protein
MLISNPPKTYSLLLKTAAPPGNVMPLPFCGQLSAGPRVVRVSVIGL